MAGFGVEHCINVRRQSVSPGFRPDYTKINSNHDQFRGGGSEEKFSQFPNLEGTTSALVTYRTEPVITGNNGGLLWCNAVPVITEQIPSTS